MKNVIYFILVSLLVFTSCEKYSPNFASLIPLPPTLSSPRDTSSNIFVPVLLTWDKSDGVNSYVVQVSENSSFSSFIFNKSNITTTTQQVPDLNYLAVYYWRVSATNSAGTSDWSKVWSFTTTGEAAFVPQLSLPENGAIYQKLSPVLTWNKVSNASKYTLQISTNSWFTNFVFNTDTLTTTSQQIVGLSGEIKYYWRVRATNNFGTKGWSETWSFTTGVVPVPPVLLSPSDGATDISLTPTLTWNESSGATSYTLQVSTNSSFTSFVLNQNVGNITSKQISRLNGLTTYYWRIKALNISGSSLWSNSWSFGTQRVCDGIETVLYANKTYNTVAIGNQCWLKENLDVGVYVVSTITGVDHSDVSNNGIIEKYCYLNNPSNCAIYGGLYMWHEAMQYNLTPGNKGVCPNGWHIPTLTEFETLETAVNHDGNALKAAGEGTGNGSGTNTSGFSALFTGTRNSDGYFSQLGGHPNLWTSSEYNDATFAYSLLLFYDNSNFYYGHDNKEVGIGIRCLKD